MNILITLLGIWPSDTTSSPPHSHLELNLPVKSVAYPSFKVKSLAKTYKTHTFIQMTFSVVLGNQAAMRHVS